MNKLRISLLGLAAAIVCLLPNPASANYYYRDGNGNLQNIYSLNCLPNVVCPAQILIDSAGVEKGTIANPVATITLGATPAGSPAVTPPILIGGTSDGSATGIISPWKVLSGVGFINCANCSGSGISVAYGGAIGGVGTPGGFKDGTGNFQPFLGDVTNGQWVSIKQSVSLAVTGTFFQATQPVSAVSLPLPALASTSTIQTNGTQKTQIVDGSGAVIASTANALNVNCANCSGGSNASVSATASPVPASATYGGMNVAGNLVGLTGTANGLKVDGSAVTQPVSLTSTTITGSVTVAQATAASLNATVVGTGTFAVQATQSGTWNIGSITTLPALVAGSAIIGKVSIDQTTPGTTNLVALAANQSVNQTQLNSVALGSPSNYGTSPGAVAVQGVNAFVTNSIGLNTTPSLANGNGVVPTQGGSVLSATNGAYTNLLQGNAALSTGNPIFAQVTNAGTFATQSAITAASGSVASGAFASGSISDGANVTLGSKADAKSAATDTTAITIMQVLKEISALEQAPASRAVTNAGTFAVQSTLAAGSAIAGKFGIDQTTPGTTNGTAIVGVNAATVLAGAGAVGTGSLRVAVGQDTTTIAGAAPGTAGAASANVLTIQGVASMTPVAGNITQVLGAAISATNGLFTNILQGNAVVSPTNPIFSSITDGTNKAAVKAASAAPVATDPALVAALSPNGNQATAANQTAPNTASVTNPTSTLTLPSTTTAYTAGTLMCTNATVATCNTALASQSFAIGNSAGAASIPRLRLTTNDATSTAWGSQTIQIDLWSAAPTFATTGDRGNFNTDFLTGSANHLGAYACVMSAELADGAYSECYPAVGSAALVKLASGTSIFWTAQAVTGSGTTGASKVFTLTAELQN